MRFGPIAFVSFLGLVFAGCATGTAADDSSTPIDSGAKHDGSTTTLDGGPKTDGGPKQDSGGPVQDSGTTSCGGQCGSQTCCSNTCVDTTSDQNNCGFCGNACGTQSCCSSNCVDTMGSDNQNCGGCGVVCNGTCMNGVCQTQTTCTVDNTTNGCTHSVCTAGSALPEDCDFADYDITYYVCEGFYTDLACCTSTWDSICVQEADDVLSYFGETCSGC